MTGITQFKTVNILDELFIQGVPVSTAGQGARSNYTLVKQKSDFPAPVSGVITLANNFDYEINGTIDLGTDRLELQGDNVIFGLNASEDRLIYSGVNPMISGSDSITRVERLAFESGTADVFDITDSGSDGTVFVSVACRYVNCQKIGNFTDVPAVDFFSSFLIGTPNGISFAGSGIIATISNTVLNITSSGTLIDLGTAVFDAINVNGNYLRSSVSTTFINAQANSANISPTGQGSILNNVTIGTPPSVNGITAGDLRWDLVANNTLPNSIINGGLFMAANATVTTINAANTPVKVAGTTTNNSNTLRYSMPSDNTIQYDGRKTLSVNVSYSVTANRASGSGTRLVTFLIYKNGSPVSGGSQSFEVDNRERAITVIANTSLDNGDQLELFVENNDDTNDILVTNLTGIVAGN